MTFPVLSLSNFFAVEDGLHQGIPVVAQLQQEEGCVLPQQIQENLISLPFRKLIQKFPADPLQFTLVALF